MLSILTVSVTSVFVLLSLLHSFFGDHSIFHFSYTFSNMILFRLFDLFIDVWLSVFMSFRCFIAYMCFLLSFCYLFTFFRVPRFLNFVVSMLFLLSLFSLVLWFQVHYLCLIIRFSTMFPVRYFSNRYRSVAIPSWISSASLVLFDGKFDTLTMVHGRYL